jgi:hypothetical protein
MRGCVTRGFIAAGPLAYWSLAGWAILSARGDPDVFAWLLAVPFTAPVSLLALAYEPGQEWERAWLTLWTATGAMANGLLAGWVLWRLGRRARPGRDEQAVDYDDARPRPPAR